MVDLDDGRGGPLGGGEQRGGGRGHDEVAGPQEVPRLGRVGDGAAEPAQERRGGLDVGDAEDPHHPARLPQGGDRHPQPAPGDDEHRAAGEIADQVERHPPEHRRDEGVEVHVEAPGVGDVGAFEPAAGGSGETAHATTRRWATGAHS